MFNIFSFYSNMKAKIAGIEVIIQTIRADYDVMAKEVAVLRKEINDLKNPTK